MVVVIVDWPFRMYCYLFQYGITCGLALRRSGELDDPLLDSTRSRVSKSVNFCSCSSACCHRGMCARTGVQVEHCENQHFGRPLTWLLYELMSSPI